MKTAMFRDLTRIKQKLSEEACREVLRQELRGVLAVNGDDGYPYALPINYYYDETNHRVYFHSGPKGHKIDTLSESDKVSFCVYDGGYRENGHWSLNIRSVILFGRLRVVEDWSDELMTAFSARFTDDTAYVQSEIQKLRGSTLVLCLEIEHMTGKLVNES